MLQRHRCRHNAHARTLAIPLYSAKRFTLITLQRKALYIDLLITYIMSFVTRLESTKQGKRAG
jgi:hypothetical protein